MYKYVWLLAIALLIMYVMYYYKYPSETVILQTTLQEFKFDLLREKQPIVIQDRVADISALKSMWFTTNFVAVKTMYPTSANNPVWNRNLFKYTLIQSHGDGTEVLLASHSYNPKQPIPEDATIVAIQLAANQCLIIPFHMLYAVVNQDEKQYYDVLEIDDIVTKLLP